MERRSAGATALTDLILEVFRLNGRLLAAGDVITGGVGESSARWQVLGSLAHEPRSAADVARGIGRARQSVGETTRRLLDDGLIKATASPDDRRTQLLQLTDRGREVLHAIGPGQRVWAHQLAKHFDVEDLRTALKVLRGLTNLLNEEEHHG